MPAARTLASVWAAKATAFASRTLGRGGGTSASGLVGLWLQPGLVKELGAQLRGGSIVITGTNGKTTTSLLISEAVRAAGLEPLANGSGSNLMRGIASTLALSVDGDGALTHAQRRVGVFEVDEATLPLVLPELRPRVAVFTNLFRDQLDRYGEVATVAARWRSALASAPSDMAVVLNADDPAVASLGEGRAAVLYFGVEDTRLHRGVPEHASDALFCRCGARLNYEVAYFGHVGHWSCPACGRARPTPHVSARSVKLGDGRHATFQLVASDEKSNVKLSIGGLYNVYNALAAAAAGRALQLPGQAVASALQSTAAAFGRQESFDIDGRRVDVFLGKNPAGLNQVLSTVLLDPARQSVLLLLNDGIADGRDISWVWDADFELAAGKLEHVVVGGTRAAEMALRLKYAEWDEASIEIEPDIALALDKAIGATPPGSCLTIIPTYTAMLTVRDLLALRSGRGPYWRERRHE